MGNVLVYGNVRFWRKADTGLTGAEWLLLTQSGHSASGLVGRRSWVNQSRFRPSLDTLFAKYIGPKSMLARSPCEIAHSREL
jgi:hypothetical protein